MRRLLISGLAAACLLAVAGCSRSQRPDPGTGTDPGPDWSRGAASLRYKPVCDKVAVTQAGREVIPDNGRFQLERQPFVITYRGAERPSVALDASDALNVALAGLQRREIWAGADFMASDDGDVPRRNDFRFFTTDMARDQQLSFMGGAKYVKLVQDRRRTDRFLDVLAVIPRLGAFDRAALGPFSLRVRSLNRVPIEHLPPGLIHLSYFGEKERIPANDPTAGLIISNWGSCVLSFQ